MFFPFSDVEYSSDTALLKFSRSEEGGHKRCAGTETITCDQMSIMSWQPMGLKLHPPQEKNG